MFLSSLAALLLAFSPTDSFAMSCKSELTPLALITISTSEMWRRKWHARQASLRGDWGITDTDADMVARSAQVVLDRLAGAGSYTEESVVDITGKNLLELNRLIRMSLRDAKGYRFEVDAEVSKLTRPPKITIVEVVGPVRTFWTPWFPK